MEATGPTGTWDHDYYFPINCKVNKSWLGPIVRIADINYTYQLWKLVTTWKKKTVENPDSKY